MNMPIVSITEEAEKLIIRLKGLSEFETGELHYKKDIIERALRVEMTRQSVLRGWAHCHKLWEEQRVEARKTLKGKIKWLFLHPPEPQFSDILPQGIFGLGPLQ